MRVGTIIETISPPVFSSAIIIADDVDNNKFVLFKSDGEKITEIDLMTLKKLDLRNCIIWDSEIVAKKFLGQDSHEELLPGIFAQGPDTSGLKDLNEMDYKLNPFVEKFLLPLVIFIAMFTLILFTISLSSQGMNMFEILKSSGIYTFGISLAVTIIFSYMLFRKEK